MIVVTKLDAVISSLQLEAPSLIHDVALIQRLRVVPSILRILCDTTGLRFAAIARVTETKWLACAVLDRLEFGLGVGSELEIGTTFCRDVHSSRAPLVIDGASGDPEFSRSPIPTQYGFESYISVPVILADGEVWGTICGIDPEPKALRGSQIVPTIEMFAELLAGQIDNERRVEVSVMALGHERALGELREQFMAILGHDLRNPVAAVSSGLRILANDPPPAKAKTVISHMQKSCSRIFNLIDDTIDLARGRLGGGIPLQRKMVTDLALDLRQVIQELQSVHSGCTVDVEIDLVVPIYCDAGRMSQMLSNLLGNAITHGSSDKAVMVAARCVGSHFVLTVANSGTPIPLDKMDSLFKPFGRAGTDGVSAGLGLGLYIASEIALSHGGTLSASSSSLETVFTFEMPMDQAVAARDP